MITLIDCRRNGRFEYADDNVSVNGFFDSDDTEKLLSINCNYSDKSEHEGNLNITRQVDDSFKYIINGANSESIVVIAEFADFIWREVEDATKKEVEQEEAEEQPSKKK